jgi:hypothetical protein
MPADHPHRSPTTLLLTCLPAQDQFLLRPQRLTRVSALEARRFRRSTWPKGWRASFVMRSACRHLKPATRPKRLTHLLRMAAMRRNNFRRTSPDGRFW